MKRNLLKYTCYAALSTSILAATIFSAACSNAEVPKMTVSYGPEIGFADGNVNLSGETPVINISDIKAEVGTNIDYLSGITVENEADFPDLEIWVDASLVDIFTPGDYKATYTFVFGDQSVSKEITVTLIEVEQSASEVASNTEDDADTDNNANTPNTNTSESETTSRVSDNSTTVNTGNSNGGSNQSTTKPTSNNNNNNNSTTNNNSSATTQNNSSTKPAATTTQPTTSSTKPPVTTTAPTTKPVATTTKPTTTRQIITTKANSTTESKSIGNYTIELLSGKNITIKNTTAKYIVSTRTDVTTVEEDGKTYRISKLIITYNTGFEQILETVKERIK